MRRVIYNFLLCLTVFSAGFLQADEFEADIKNLVRALKPRGESHHNSSSSKSHHKKLRIPRVCDIAEEPVGCQGTMVYNKRDDFIYYSDGTRWIPLETAEPAPAVITVDPSFTCPDNVTEFTTIQAAIDSLGSKKIVNTTINVLPGAYGENLVLQSILNSDATKLNIIGDARPIVGVGYVHDSFWNVTATPNTTVGGGNNSRAQFVTAGNTLTITNVGSGIQPNFLGVGGPQPNDQVLIRDNTGGVQTYTIQSVAATSLTFTAPISPAANALGAAMTVLPTVIVAPAAGSPLTTSTLETFTGFYFKAPTAVATVGIQILPYAFLRLTNCVLFNDSTGGGINQDASNNLNLGVTPFGNTIFSRGTTITSNIYSRVNAANSLIARSVAGPVAFTNYSALTITNSKLIGAGSAAFAMIFATGGTRIETLNPADLICTGNVCILAAQGSNIVVGLTGHLIIRGAPTVGIDLASGSVAESPTPTRVSLSSTDANFIGLRIGNTPANGDATSEVASATLNFGTVSLPNSANAYLAQVLNNSRLNVGNLGLGGGTVTFGTNANGFLVSNNSTLTYNGTGAPGSITGNAASTTSRLFDIQRGSSLIIPPGTTRTFTNFSRTFNFDEVSQGAINNVTSVTTTGGTNLKADNMSRVEIDTVSFNGGVGGIGIQTSNGAFVGKKGGTVVTIVPPTLAISPPGATQLTTDPIGSYTSTYATGTVVISP